MRKYLLFILVSFLPLLAVSQNGNLNLIPWPLEVKQPVNGNFLLTEKLNLYTDFPEAGRPVLISYLRDKLKGHWIDLDVVKNEKDADIRILMRRMPTGGKPAYKLVVDQTGITIESNFDAPAFHGIQTFLQLIPLTLPPAPVPPVPAKVEKDIPYVEIFDHARFEYRGMHLDVSRHFSTIDFIKKYIDYLAYHKLNVFHWHLTDDQGWRIEIKNYPELTRIGGWRNGTIIGRYPGTGSDNIAYGGFYTQDEVREVVKYAANRFIDVIPEIEMPGHSSAAIAAYPFLSCFPEKPTMIPANMISKKSVDEQKNGRIKLVQETWGIFDDVFCAGNDSTFTFLQNVIDEVLPLFPSKYFHIGGDECPKTHWKKCPKCQKRIKELKLKDEHELQSYFVQRMEKYLNRKGKILIGWDEILEGGLAPNAVVMSWRGEKGGIEAARQKHFVIMTPSNPVYFDHTQSENEDSVTIGGYNPLEKVYAYEPIPKELTEEEGKYVLGAQANVWREYIKNDTKTEYTIFPRMSALSEVLWSSKENRNWERFTRILPYQIKRYQSWGANYSNEFYSLKSKISPYREDGSVLFRLESRLNKPIRLNFNGIDLDTVYTDPIVITESTLIRATQDDKNSLVQSLRFNKATGRKITLKDEASSTYPGDGAFTLINGVISEKGFSRTREFLGWSGKNCEAVIDLGSEQKISYVVVNSLKRRSSWIWEPAGAEVLVSADGETWKSVKFSDTIQDEENQKVKVVLDIPGTSARYVKVIVRNSGKIPAGNPGAGRDAWLFVDEIEVE